MTKIIILDQYLSYESGQLFNSRKSRYLRVKFLEIVFDIF